MVWGVSVVIAAHGKDYVLIMHPSALRDLRTMEAKAEWQYAYQHARIDGLGYELTPRAIFARYREKPLLRGELGSWSSLTMYAE